MTSRKPHPHADLIHAWADGAEIEVSVCGEGWREAYLPLWLEHKKYRIKPRTITVPEHEVPEPVWVPVDGEEYYQADPAFGDGVVIVRYEYYEPMMQLKMAERGLLYPRTDEGKAHAIQRAKAMWLTRPGSDDERYT